MSVAEQASIAGLPAVPLTIEGSSVLHQMMRFRWAEWRKLRLGEQGRIAAEAAAVLGDMEKSADGWTSVYSLLGHKGDFLFLHFRNSFDALESAQLNVARLPLSDFLEPVNSYLSVVELGLYDSTLKVYSALAARGVQPYSPEWNTEIEATVARQRDAMQPRLYPERPTNRYLCFYPMDRRRGEDKNWYQLPMAERQRQMHEHGMVGRRYAGEVRQIITGSIGFDDWEWGVDLFADDALVFKKLIYEMRFDEVSAVYALFGAFHVGLLLPAAELPDRLAVTPPSV